ncbi:MAG: MaoC family dehydratase [Alphaproteobacteria bacterium]|nr:MaoC family dehydratase [Alphaproteobacteria bacterium]
MDLYFEDLEIGRTFHSLGKTMTEAEIVDFAFKYDPQPFHIDKGAAEEGPFGGLIASGFQTLAVAFRMFIETGAFRAGSMGSPGMEELKWLRPVRPGDTLRSVVEILDKRESKSKPDRGILLMELVCLNQDDEPVMSYKCNVMFRKRPAGEPAAG